MMRLRARLLDLDVLVVGQHGAGGKAHQRGDEAGRLVSWSDDSGLRDQHRCSLNVLADRDGRC